MKLYFALITLLLSQSCGQKPATTSTPAELEFASIVNGIPVIELPLQLGLWPNTVPLITDPKTLAWQDQFLKKTYRSIWGRVYVDQPYVHLLATQSDDLGTVFLVTFDKSGKLISQESLQRGEYVSADLNTAPTSTPHSIPT